MYHSPLMIMQDQYTLKFHELTIVQADSVDKLLFPLKIKHCLHNHCFHQAVIGRKTASGITTVILKHVCHALCPLKTSLIAVND